MDGANPGGSKLKTELGPRHFASFAYSVEIPARIQTWHNMLGHPETTMFRRMIPTLASHMVCLSNVAKLWGCASCSQGKFLKQPSKWKLPSELREPLEHLQGDICGPFVPPSGPFRYFLVLVDASGCHAKVSLLSTRNMAFPKLLAMILKIRAHYPNANIKTLCMDNAGEFKSQTFEDYCVASGITLTYAVPYEHSENSLTEAYIKKIQLVVRPLLIHAKLPSSLWGHAVLHAAALFRLRPTLLHTQTPLELVSGKMPNISHLRTFGCRVWVPVSELKLKTIGTHRLDGIYVGFDSPIVIRYLSIPAGTLFRAQFQNSHFDETIFPILLNTKDIGLLDFFAPQTFIQNPDPSIALIEQEVRKLVSLKALADRLKDGFVDAPCIIRDPAPGAGPPSLPYLPKKCKAEALHTDLQASKPTSLEKAQKSSEWPHWSLALQAEYNSFRKHQVFGPLVPNLPTKPMGHKLIFTKKQNPDGQVTRYKVRLVAEGFNQRPELDYDFTYSPVVDSGTFRYLLGTVVQFSLKIHLLDVVTGYLHGPPDTKLYIRPSSHFLPQPIPPESPGSYPRLRIQKALYGLKQAGWMWYQHLKEFLTAYDFLTNHTLPCIFIYRNQK